MKRLLIHLFIALITFSVGFFLRHAFKSYSSNIGMQIATNRQQSEQKILLNGQAYSLLKSKFQQSGCENQAQMSENRRLFCDVLQIQINDLSKSMNPSN